MKTAPATLGSAVRELGEGTRGDLSMSDILAILAAERDKLNRAIEALGGEVGNAIIRLTKSGKPEKRRTMSGFSKRAGCFADERGEQKTKKRSKQSKHGVFL
jgi:hypothetical protein